MKVYNTLSRKKEDFVPIDKEKENVKMYVCGPTVYNYIHIGNARPYVIFDTVRRYLEYKGYNVIFVQNFTDVDDKIIKRANEECVSMFDISNRYIAEALKDAKGLNIKDASYNPRVTEEIPAIIDMIATLVDKGFAYVAGDSVFFDTRSFNGYGKLSKKNIDDLRAGARVELNEQKKDSMDFVLWKPHKPGEPKWNSPWGEGRPGWHIECSVMAKKYLGDTIDIHAGGEDLIFPHHENEIAQSEAANGVTFAKYWLHNGFINIENQKMSKSKGNFFTLREISEEFPYEVIRFFILSCHYRSPLNFSREQLQSSTSSLNRIKNCVLNLDHLIAHSNIEDESEKEKLLFDEMNKFKIQFENSMDDDFNTADACAAIFDLIRFVNVNVTDNSSKTLCEKTKQFISKLCSILGLEINSEKKMESAEVEALIEERENARKCKNWAEADVIRDKLNSMGVVIEDTRQGIRWSYRGR